MNDLLQYIIPLLTVFLLYCYFKTRAKRKYLKKELEIIDRKKDVQQSKLK